MRGAAGSTRAAAGSRKPPGEVEALMRRSNPAFIPRNHNVEAALLAASSANHLGVMERLLDVLTSPYDHARDLPEFSTPASGERPYVTFCGT